MTKCKQCEKPTDNPKFCSRSCASSYNNHKYPKRTTGGGKYSRRRCPTKCRVCKKTFKPCPGSVGIVCSQTCQHKLSYVEWSCTVDKSKCFQPSANSKVPPKYKRYLIDKYGHQCQICKRKTWLGQPINLVFDHIDGDSNNWKLSNCRLICNNCDSTLPTYKGRNKGKGRHMRKQRYKQGKSY